MKLSLHVFVLLLLLLLLLVNVEAVKNRGTKEVSVAKSNKINYYIDWIRNKLLKPLTRKKRSFGFRIDSEQFTKDVVKVWILIILTIVDYETGNRHEPSFFRVAKSCLP